MDERLVIAALQTSFRANSTVLSKEGEACMSRAPQRIFSGADGAGQGWRHPVLDDLQVRAAVRELARSMQSEAALNPELQPPPAGPPAVPLQPQAQADQLVQALGAWCAAMDQCMQ